MSVAVTAGVLAGGACGDSATGPSGVALTVELRPFPSASEAGSTLEIGIRVLDRDVPVGGVRVAWSVSQGGGRLDSASAVTSDDGRAGATWTLGSGLGVNRSVVELDNGAAVAFNVVAVPARPVGLEIAGPAAPPVGAAATYRIRVTDRLGNALPEVALTLATSRVRTRSVDACWRDLSEKPPRCAWEDMAQVDPRALSTDVSGEATAEVTFPLSGAHHIVVLAPGLEAADSVEVDVLPPDPEATGFRWRPAPALDLPRLVAADGDAVYLLGGCQGGACQNHRYDVASGALTDIPGESPFVWFGGWATVAAGGVHVVTEGPAGNEHFRLDLTTEAWTNRSPIPEDFPGAAFSWLDFTLQFTAGDRLHILDGYDLWVYRADTDLWSRESIAYELNVDPYAVTAAAFGADVYFFGGREEGAGIRLGGSDRVLVRDVIASTWGSSDPLPVPWRHAWAGRVGGHVCVFGGEVFEHQREGDPDVFCYDPGAGSWERGPAWPGVLDDNWVRDDDWVTLQVGDELWVYPPDGRQGWRLVAAG